MPRLGEKEQVSENAVISRELWQALRDPKCVHPDQNSVVLSREHLDRIRRNASSPIEEKALPMKNTSVIPCQSQGPDPESARRREEATNADIAAARTALLARKARKAAGLSRREKMTALEDHRLKRIAELEDADRKRQLELQRLLAMKLAAEAADAREPEVKKMESMVLTAKVMAICDAQIAERKQLEKETKEYERQLDAIMEADRVANIKKSKVRDRMRQEKLDAGARELRKQIAERENIRRLQRLRKQKEGEEMLKRLKQEQERQQREELERIKEGERLLAEVKAANEAALARRQQQLEFEREEERKIAEYIRKKDTKDRKLEEEKQREQQMRERKAAIIAGTSQRIADKRAHLDMIRARRESEAAERKWRENKKLEAERRQRFEQEVRASRDAQIKHKAEVREREKQLAALEAEQAKRKHELEKRERAQQHEEVLQKQAKYRQQLREQIEEIESKKKQEQGLSAADVAAAAQRNKEEREMKLSKLEGIRERFLQDLRNAGVPERYHTELIRHKFTEV
ncbi:MAG: hypothetical protein MHM6MM_006413 [Cercozoa sp. M6MM]